MNRIAALSIVAAAACFATESSAACKAEARGGLKPKALVVMLDGMRADAVENAYAENIRMLRDGKWQDGYKCSWSLCANTILDTITVSGPNHVSIATGVTFAKHGVSGNGNNVCDFSKWPSWLKRVVDARPGTKALFMFSWDWDKSICPTPAVNFIHAKDDANAKSMPGILSAPDAPDAIMWYIDYPDHAGHGFGYYPYTREYLRAVYLSDRAIGGALKAIASRPTFAEEDWLVIVTADHGGYLRSHGMMNGQATTIPLLVSGRGVSQGRIPGTPHNYDVAPTVLKHFGIDSSGMNLDGKAVGGEVEAETRRPLSDALAAYMAFDGGAAKNEIAGGPALEIADGKQASLQKSGLVGGCLGVTAGTNGVDSAVLKGSENLVFENGSDFAFTVWVQMREKEKGDPVIFSNKDWRSVKNAGLALIASKFFREKVMRQKEPGVAFNLGLKNGGRNDLGPYGIDRGEWVFYAATLDKLGTLRFYQGGRDGNLYMMSENAAGAMAASGLPFRIGQDGTGKYSFGFTGQIDDLALWTRTLPHDDVRRIYEAGRRGVPLSGLLTE